ncbi:MAG: HAMP domain-containing histidine kinase, partial [Gammaproteobacteria bacterium]|nr:HAMP domain-containing histidine kinase [Gammaproteobacteria bacterium]
EIFKNIITNTPRQLTPYITNENGYFLAHPNLKMTYGFDHGNDYTIQKTYNDFNLRKDNDLRDVEFTVTSNGDVLHVVKAFYDPAQTDRFFAVMLATSYENLQSGSKQLRLQSFLIMGLLVIISLIVAAILASRLLHPLQLISVAADDLAHGREVSNLPVEANDEIGELARSFDNMHMQLEEKERQLIISQGHVHHANKLTALGEMASGMAHEINSPIQTISLIAQRVQRQLKKNISDEDIHESMEKITSSVNKISEIIDSLRKVSRASTKDEFKFTKLKELIEDVINMSDERFKVNNVHFEVNYYNLSENTLIQCQRLQLSQVLINLVNNAYDAIQSLEDKWIIIDFEKRGEIIQVSVTDSGAGIADDIQDKIFEPMFTTKEIGKGTGLGLSISNDIITKHNGTFYIDKESKNTRFIIELPILYSAESKTEN